MLDNVQLLLCFYMNINKIVMDVQSHRTTPLLRNGKVSYEGVQLWRTAIRSATDMDFIQKLHDSQEISVWNLNHYDADYLVREDTKMKVYRHLRSRRLNHSVIIMDVQRRINAQKLGLVYWDVDALRLGHRLNWNTYPTLKIIYEYFDYLVNNYASICKIQSIGQSVERRPIKMVTISNSNPKNKGIIILAGVHAREWAGITSSLYIINEIVTKFDSQPFHIKNKDWYIIPVLNPDGFQYTHDRDRLWRKNRKRSDTRTCHGVDINRNFGRYWSIPEAMETDECKESYGGLQPFSEPEAIALRDLIQKSTTTKPVAFVDIHSYGQLIMYPWASTSTPVPHQSLLNSTARGMSQAIFQKTKKIYSVGNCYHTIYPASGTIVDWIYSAGVHQAYAIETRDKGVHGFLLPSEQIEDTGKEIFAAINHLTKVIDPASFKRTLECHEWF